MSCLHQPLPGLVCANCRLGKKATGEAKEIDTSATAQMMTEMALELKAELRKERTKVESVMRENEVLRGQLLQLKRDLRKAQRALPIAEAK